MFCSNLDTHVTRQAKSELPCRMLCSHDTLRKPRKSGPARALDPCRSPQGSWALGTRHNCLRVRLEFSAHAQKNRTWPDRRGRDSWCRPKGPRPLETRMVMFCSPQRRV